MSTETETYTERLRKVREAIDQILSGSQSWMLGNKQYTRATLSTLYDMEKRYAKLANQEQAAARGRGGRSRVRYIGF
ncbi:hypothetical protein [Halomonas caseinilytica]|uniref:GpW protein n=1 Tax=Halomonas caseinilytica TaxID=438744 RepID=A0A1M7B6C6_9GAMM|nr:hypothetical protein [Halomonas caseinilytica]SHL50209.1 hypothetical protein SAMN05192556_11820 [Halomonas caseinilytica]